MGIGWLNIPVEKLVKAEWNYKGEDPVKSEKLKNNIKRNGQVENLLIRELSDGSFEVVNGNHRLDVMRELGMKEAHAYNFGAITEQEAKRIAIETNETRFQSATLKLAELISELDDHFGIEDLKETMPYDEEELKNFSALLDFDWEQYSNTAGVDPLPDERKITITVHKDNYQDFLDSLNEFIVKYNAKVK